MSLDNGLAGWGWVPDVHPNPQNTAEAVCAYATIGEQIPFAERVVKMLQTDKTSNWSGQDWEFTTSIDWAWRLRALVMLDRSMRGLVEPRLIDRHAYQLVNLLRENGWSIAGDDDDDVSIFATSLALQALGIAGYMPDDPRLRQAWTLIADAAIDPGDDCPLATRSYALACLATPELVLLRNSGSDRAQRIGSERLLNDLVETKVEIEEEIFFRKNVSDRWRHVILPLAVQAIATANPSAVGDPAFRGRFQALCELQQMDGVNMGGFCNTHYGQVTSYATASAVHAIDAVDKAFQTTLSPAQVMDLIFAKEGSHHTDPQRLIQAGHWKLMMNSGAALAAAVIVTMTTMTAIVPLWISSSGLTQIARRFIVSIDFYMIFLVWYWYAACRLQWMSRKVLAGIFFSAATAVLFPAISLLI